MEKAKKDKAIDKMNATNLYSQQIRRQTSKYIQTDFGYTKCS